MEINDIKKTRWNFIGLASEEKPVPETSPDVVNGSTFYEVDTCKLFFWCDGFKLATNNYQVRISTTYLLA